MTDDLIILTSMYDPKFPVKRGLYHIIPNIFSLFPESYDISDKLFKSNYFINQHIFIRIFDNHFIYQTKNEKTDFYKDTSLYKNPINYALKEMDTAEWQLEYLTYNSMFVVPEKSREIKLMLFGRTIYSLLSTFDLQPSFFNNAIDVDIRHLSYGRYLSYDESAIVPVKHDYFTDVEVLKNHIHKYNLLQKFENILKHHSIEYNFKTFYYLLQEYANIYDNHSMLKKLKEIDYFKKLLRKEKINKVL